MFSLELVPVTLRRLSLRMADGADDAGQARHSRLCFCAFRIEVLGYELAAAAQLPIAAQCFGKNRKPLPSLREVHFAPPADDYLIALAAGALADGFEALPPLVTLAGARLIKIRVWQPKEAAPLALDFVTCHELARSDGKDLAALLLAWEQSDLFATFTATQIPIPLEPDDDSQPQQRATH